MCVRVCLNIHLWATSELVLLFSHEVMSDSFAVSWTVAHKTPLSVGFPRQEYWSGLPSQRDLPDPGDEHRSPALAGGVLTRVYHKGSNTIHRGNYCRKLHGFSSTQIYLVWCWQAFQALSEHI